MKNVKKITGLTFLLVFPVFVIWFLKSFGENKFTIPVFHQDATSIPSDKCAAGEGQHYIPSFSLRNKNGDLLTEQFLEEKITVISFFNSKCVEACQELNSELLRLKGNFETVPAVQILSLSTDPTDGPAALKAYAEGAGLLYPSWNFATGEKDMLDELLQCGFILPEAEISAAVSNPENLQMVLIDGQGRIRGYYGHDQTEVDRLITEITILLEEHKQA